VHQPRRNLGVRAGAAEVHHEAPGYIHGNVRAQILCDYVESEIEACRDAGARVHQSVLNEDPVLEDAGSRLDAAQLLDVFVVSRALASSEEACARGEHAPRADAHKCSGPCMGAQPCDQALRRGIVSIAARTAGAHKHNDRTSRELRRKGSKSAELQAPRGRGAAVIRDELQPVTSRHDLGGDTKGIGRAGQVQQHNIGQQHEDHVSHGYPSADHRGPLRSGVSPTRQSTRGAWRVTVTRRSKTAIQRKHRRRRDCTRPRLTSPGSSNQSGGTGRCALSNRLSRSG
jgi:hypothetical protein